MQSLKYLYRIGKGPSSSHTMGPLAAARRFLSENGAADEYKAVLYGSLAKTGRGHMTDAAILEAFFGKKCEIVFDNDTPTDYHPNMIDIMAFSGGKETKRERFFSVGGGEVIAEQEEIPLRDRAGEYIMLRLRTLNGISGEDYERRFRLPFAPLEASLEKQKDYGNATKFDDGRWRLTPKGYLVSNTIISDLLLAQDEAEALGKRV